LQKHLYELASHLLDVELSGIVMICRIHCFNYCLIMRAVGDTRIISTPLVISAA
jgi:hypothetical protein